MPTPCPNIVSYALSGDYDPSRPILIDAANPARSITKTSATSLIASLTGVFKPGSTVVLHLANDITYPILYMAILASGCRWVGTNVAYTACELEHIFKVSKANYVITDHEHLETVRAATGCSGTQAETILFADILNNPHADSLPDARDYAHFGAKTENSEMDIPKLHRKGSFNFRTLHDLQHNGTPDALFAAIEKIDIDSIAVLMSTSGTTGPPKMATRTHRAMVLEAIAVEDNHSAKPYPVRRLFCTPIFHGFSAPDMIINSLRLGLTNFFMKRFNPVVFPEKIAEFQITEIFAPPPMLSIFINRPESHPQIQSIEAVYTGGAPLAPELRKQFLRLFNNTAPIIFPVYGMTEGGWFAVSKYPHDDTTGSVGHIVPGTEVKMLSTGEHASTLHDGTQVGPILVKSEMLMTGYEGNPKATAESFDEDGWLNTGDIGHVKNGKIYLVDRAKDLIKVNGWQVAPAEIEDALLMSANVKDAGVIGMGEGLEEHPLAFVVRANEDVTEEALKEHLLTRLTRYKVMSCKIEFIDAIPKSISGKILKKDLRKMMAERATKDF
jgi:acyl-CoA synthetase (AMP-forming)/AMP-acid ligase II